MTGVVFSSKESCPKQTFQVEEITSVQRTEKKTALLYKQFTERREQRRLCRSQHFSL